MLNVIQVHLVSQMQELLTDNKTLLLILLEWETSKVYSRYKQIYTKT